MSDSNRVRLAWVEEGTWGTDPPAGSQIWKGLRFTGEALEAQKSSEPSEVIRADRVVDSVAELSQQAAGTVDIELAVNQLTTFIEMIIGAAATTPVGVTAVAATNTTIGQETLAAAGVGTGLVVGHDVVVSGFSNALLNGVFQVITQSAGSITVRNPKLPATGVSGSGGVVSHRNIRNPPVPFIRSIAMLKEFTDKPLSKVLYFTGLRPGMVSFNATAQQRITGQVGFDGRRGQFLTKIAEGASTTPGATDPLTGSASVAFVEYSTDDQATWDDYPAPIQSLEMEINGGNRLIAVVGNKYPADIGQGTIAISGTINGYFIDSTVFDLMTAHTYFALRIAMVDAAGNGFSIVLPRVQFTEGAPTASGRNTDVIEPKSFIAVNSSTKGYCIQVCDALKTGAATFLASGDEAMMMASRKAGVREAA